MGKVQDSAFSWLWMRTARKRLKMAFITSGPAAVGKKKPIRIKQNKIQVQSAARQIKVSRKLEKKMTGRPEAARPAAVRPARARRKPEKKVTSRPEAARPARASRKPEKKMTGRLAAVRLTAVRPARASRKPELRMAVRPERKRTARQNQK